MLAYIIIGWFICGVVAYGLSFAHWQRRYPGQAEKDYWADLKISLVFGAFGPIGLFATVIQLFNEKGFRGFKLW